MAHTLQERYAKLVLAKLRNDIVLKDGVVFNTKYEGSPKAGAVKIPVRDTEVVIGAYDKATGKALTTGGTTYLTVPIDKDMAINEVIDGYDAQAVPDNLLADRLDSGAYVMSSTTDVDGMAELAKGTGVAPGGSTALTKSNIYSNIVSLGATMSTAKISKTGRYLLVSPATYALILTAPEFIHASNLGDSVIQSGVQGRIAGFNIIECNYLPEKTEYLAGHPEFATRIMEFVVNPHVVNLTNEFIGASAVQGRAVYGHKLTRPETIFVKKIA